MERPRRRRSPDRRQLLVHGRRRSRHCGRGTWSDDARYEATIWDFTDRAEVGRISTDATGQSYMPAVILPIPIIAPVQGTACDGIGEQLLNFLSASS